MAWISSTFGADSMRRCPVILPTQEFFPDPYEADEDSAERIFSRVCSYLKVDRKRVTLRMIAGQHDDRGGASSFSPREGPRERTKVVRVSRKR